MKLIIQIPCFNETQTLAETIADLPRTLAPFDQVEYLVVDDGSHDETGPLARSLGVHHVVRHRRNRGLARAFASGLDAALRCGADVIVNTDGDNQYSGADIARLVAPIVNGQADVVIGDRQTWSLPHFGFFKRVLQRAGSYLVGRLSGAWVPDAVSGFRAFSRDAALRLNVVTTFSYTIETLIQAGRSRLAIVSVPITARQTTRPSRLFHGMPQFLRRSGTTMLRVYAMHRPLTLFFSLGLALVAVGIVPIARFIYFYLQNDGAGHIQSLILGSTALLLGGSAWVLGLLADLIAANRRLLELTLEKVRRIELRLVEAEAHRPAAPLETPPAITTPTPPTGEHRPLIAPTFTAGSPPTFTPASWS